MNEDSKPKKSYKIPSQWLQKSSELSQKCCYWTGLEMTSWGTVQLFPSSQSNDDLIPRWEARSLALLIIWILTFCTSSYFLQLATFQVIGHLFFPFLLPYLSPFPSSPPPFSPLPLLPSLVVAFTSHFPVRQECTQEKQLWQTNEVTSQGITHWISGNAKYLPCAALAKPFPKN